MICCFFQVYLTFANSSINYPNSVLFSNNSYQFKRGTTEVRTAKVIPLEVESTQTFYIAADGSRKAGEKMDTSS